MRHSFALALGVLLMLSGVALVADTFIYDFNGEGWTRVGRVRSKEDSSIACIAGGCHQVTCSGCHTNAVDPNRYGASAENHQRIYFPRAKVEVAEGRKITVNGATIARQSGRLVYEDSRGRRFRFPQDTILVKGRDGQPFIAVYTGDIAPQLMR